MAESKEDLYNQKCTICGKTLKVRPHYWMGGLNNIFLECPERHSLNNRHHTVMGLWVTKQVKEWAGLKDER